MLLKLSYRILLVLARHFKGAFFLSHLAGSSAPKALDWTWVKANKQLLFIKVHKTKPPFVVQEENQLENGLPLWTRPPCGLNKGRMSATALELCQSKSELHGRFLSRHKSPHFCEVNGDLLISINLRVWHLQKMRLFFPFQAHNPSFPSTSCTPDVSKMASYAPALFEEATMGRGVDSQKMSPQLVLSLQIWAASPLVMGRGYSSSGDRKISLLHQMVTVLRSGLT